MTLRNRFLVLATGIFFMLACNNNRKQYSTVKIDVQKAKALFKNNNKILVLPCIACGCFEPALNDAFLRDSSFFKEVYCVTDTTCKSLSFSTHHLSQRNLDSISDEIYNVTLIQFSGDQYRLRIIDSDENGRLLKIAHNFFEN